MHHRDSFKRPVSYWWLVGGLSSLIVALSVVLTLMLSGNIFN